MTKRTNDMNDALSKLSTRVTILQVSSDAAVVAMTTYLNHAAALQVAARDAIAAAIAAAEEGTAHGN